MVVQNRGEGTEPRFSLFNRLGRPVGADAVSQSGRGVFPATVAIFVGADRL
jgi:hypothetical protein